MAVYVCLSLSVCVCLPACQSVCLSVSQQSVYLSIYISYLSIYLSIYFSIYLSIHPPNHPPIDLSNLSYLSNLIYLIYPSIYLIYLYVCLSVYLSLQPPSILTLPSFLYKILVLRVILRHIQVIPDILWDGRGEGWEGLTSRIDMRAWEQNSTKKTFSPGIYIYIYSLSLSLSLCPNHTDRFDCLCLPLSFHSVAVLPYLCSQRFDAVPVIDNAAATKHISEFQRAEQRVFQQEIPRGNNESFTLDFCLEKKLYSVTVGITTIIIIHPWTPPVFSLPCLPFLPTSPTVHQHCGQVKFLLQTINCVIKMSRSIRYKHCDACNNVG